MKILYICQTLALYGGIERVWADKMNQLVNVYNFKVFLLTYNQGEHTIPYRLDHRICHIDLNVRTHLKYKFHGLKRLIEGIKRHKVLHQRMFEEILHIAPDVIVTPTSGEILLLLKIKGTIPLVVESHSGYDHMVEFRQVSWKNRVRLFFKKKHLKNVDAIIALTENDANKWKNYNKKVLVIPNIVNLNTTSQYSNCLNKRVIFVGRFERQKMIPDLLKIWNLVHKKHLDWQLDMYGDGEDKIELIKDIKSLNAKINVHRPVQNIHDKYRESSILVLTSEYEPFGLVIPEAMSCGIPVVSFEGDGPCSIIEDGKDGYVVKDRSIRNFVSRLCLLIENEELRKRMGRNAIESSKRFAPEIIMPMWKELFGSLVKE